jgi:hypothetical protein
MASDEVVAEGAEGAFAALASVAACIQRLRFCPVTVASVEIATRVVRREVKRREESTLGGPSRVKWSSL